MNTQGIIPEPSFTKTTLNNGLEVIARRQGSLPLVAVNLWYHVGSKNEVRGQRGFAHLFEHLMFEGSRHFPGDFFQPLLRLGAGVNGSTSTDRTNYYIDLPTAHLELALAMESDRMGFLVPALSEEKLRVQKGVVRNEFDQNYANRPYGRAWALLCEALYPPSHPYSWLTIGVMDEVERASLADVSAFFERYYVPANASLSLVGDIDEDAAIALAERYFGSIPPGVRPVAVPVDPTRLSGSPALRLHDRVELDRAYDVWPSVPQFHRDDAALSLLADILGRGRVSRLYQALVETGVAQNVSVQHASRELAGTFSVVVTLRPGRAIAQARDIVLSQIGTIAGQGPTPEELARARQRRAAGFIYALDNIGGFGGVADRLNAYNVYLGDPAGFVNDLRRFEEVTAADVQRVAAAYLAGRDRLRLDVVSYSAPVSAAIDRTIRPAAAPAARYRAPVPEVRTLDSGATLWAIPDRGLPIVAAGAVVAAGGASHDTDRAGLANLASLVIDEGTRHRDAHALAGTIEDRGSHLWTGCGYHGTSILLQALTPHFEEGLALAAEVLLEPAFPEVEVSRLRGQVLDSLRAERDSAEARAQRALLAAVYPAGHPYRVPLEGETATVERLGRDDLAGFHDAHFRPDRTAWIVAGDVVVDDVARRLDQLLSSWRGSGPAVPEPSPVPVPDRPRVLLLDRPGAPQAVLRAGHAGVSRTEPEYVELLLFNQILGGQFTSRLNERLREQKGLTYGVRSHLDARVHPGPFWIGGSFQSDRLAEAIELIREELAGLLDDRTATESELADARRSLVEGQARHFEGPSALVSRFGGLFLHGLPPDEHRRLPERLEAVTLEAMLAAARRVVRPEALRWVIVADARQVEPALGGLSWAAVQRIDDLGGAFPPIR
jgi:zinc protease